MTAYIIRRILFMIPTLFGIMVLNFLIVQAAPGGPVERMVAQLTDITSAHDATARLSGSGSDSGAASQSLMRSGGDSLYRGGRGLDPDLIRDIEKMYGFDKPPLDRFLQMIGNYLRFDFGESFYRNERVITLIMNTLPVTISLGLWTTLITYLVSIPLGIRKAVRDGSAFDIASSWIIIIGYAIPSFLFAILLIIVFAGGGYFQWFPLKGLTSDNWAELSPLAKIGDYFWHIALPVTAMVISGFASLTMLTKNCFLDEISKQYVLTARAKGLSEREVLYGHVFRNAMLIVIAGFPGALLSILFRSALLIEIIFSLNGLGLLGYEAVVGRDYPVMFGTLYIFTLLGLVFGLIGDIVYMLVDPRIDFEKRAI
ncbi:MAG: microcin C ABC transporter permease YejB [Alphaproteobacteria bacterium]|nr:microcin C ABC transporter permease YejB [Alphaproteobacteria bacterium]